MKCLSVILLLVAATTAAPFSDHELGMWESFKVEHSKTYASKEEELFRMKIFIKNIHEIAEHNQLYEQGLFSFSLGLNHFSDMTHEEIFNTMNGIKFNYGDLVNCKQPIDLKETYDKIQAPPQVDWREKGAVTEVKNQNLCLSCWAFSAIGALEGRHFIKNGALVSLSEQNVLDCSRDYGTKGCNEGSWMSNAYDYIRENKGIDTEGGYPYEGKDGPCRYTPENKGAEIDSHVCLPPGNEEILMKEVATGPVSVAVDANHTTFDSYDGTGIYYEPQCGSSITHAMTLVGYGTENGQDYWLLKNSWGTTWGLSGYMKLARNRNNHCGIASAAIYPNVK